MNNIFSMPLFQLPQARSRVWALIGSAYGGAAKDRVPVFMGWFTTRKAAYEYAALKPYVIHAVVRRV